MPIPALILAAGASTRLGYPKQLATLDGEPLLTRAIRSATEAGLSPVLVVLGANAAQIQQACKLTDFILNPDWQQGMATSIHAGLQHLQAAKNDAPEGVVLMTCDQPAVDAEHLRKLVRLGVQTTEPVASRYRGDGGNERQGVPAYFPLTHLPQLALLTGDTGAKNLLASAKTVQLNWGEVDIDTQDALAQARTLFER
jgi:CTP:molybdopterin cytidylyltransferase MocA